MPDTYDHITLMCRLKAAQRRNKELESGGKIYPVRRTSSERVQRL